jgi:GntR family transcriptional repressor for pyruvate dehydrogenase complex
MSKKPIFSKPVKKQTMAEQMAEAVQESILSGELESGAVLPTEPELAEQFGVSRAVVRDATRILMARGLVEVVHGRGVFVTQPHNEAFGEALLLALRRVGATAWDVEQFEQIILPEVVALAATSASDEEITQIRGLAEEYLKSFADHQTKWWDKETPTAELERLMAAFRQVMQAIFAATHNQVFLQLARPLLNLRNLRIWAEAEDSTPELITAVELSYIRQLIAAIAGRDPAQARATVARLVELPPEAIEAMRQTPVGQISVIPIPLPRQCIFSITRG